MENTDTPKAPDAANDVKFLAWGYKAAIFLSIAGLIFSAAYLFGFLIKSHPEALRHDTMAGFSAERRMVLLSTGIFVAMAFGFLGFALFLIQAKGEVEGMLEYKDYKVNIARMSPGLFVILCATVIIIFCATFRIDYTVVPTTRTEAKPTEDDDIKSRMPQGPTDFLDADTPAMQKDSILPLTR